MVKKKIIKKIKDAIDPPAPTPTPPDIITAEQLLENLGGYNDLDNVTLNAVSNKLLRDAELQQAAKNKVKAKQEVDIEDILSFDEFRDLPRPEQIKALENKKVAPKEIFDFSLDTVSPLLTKIDPNTGETLIKLDTRTDTYYPLDQVKQVIKPLWNRGKKGRIQIRKSYKLIEDAKEFGELTPDEYKKLGADLATTPEGQEIINQYLSGKMSKNDLAAALQNAFPKKVGKLASPSDRYTSGFQMISRRVDPIIDGIYSTLDDSHIINTFTKHYKATRGESSLPRAEKIVQADNVLQRFNSKEFNEIILPDGTKMGDQPFDYRLINAYAEMVPDAFSSKLSYSNFVNRYLKDMYYFKNPNAEPQKFTSPTVYEKVEGTPFIYDTRVGEASRTVPPAYFDDYKKASDKIKAFIPDSELKQRADRSFYMNVARMIDFAEREAKKQGLEIDPSEITQVIENINPEALANLFVRKAKLEKDVEAIKNSALSPYIRNTNKELYPEFDLTSQGRQKYYLIEVSHIEDVARNWRAALDINNLFLGFGKFNRQQRYLDDDIQKQLEALKNATSNKERARIKRKLASIERELVNKNLISKVNDTYFGVDKDSDVESSVLRMAQEAADMSRYYADGGLVSFEEVLEYDYD